MNKTYKPINQKKISEQVYDQLSEMISSGQLKPDEKLESERTLSTLLNVSRTSVREALLKLECAGLIEQRHGEGTYIKSAVGNDLNPIFEVFCKNRDCILDLVEIRTVLESWAASVAAERITDEQLSELSCCLESMKKMDAEEIKQNLSNYDFHKLISLSTHNILLVHTLNIFSSWFRQLTSTMYEDSYDTLEMHAELLRQHEEIFLAIKQHDKEKAARAMREHLAYTRKKMEQISANK